MDDLDLLLQRKSIKSYNNEVPSDEDLKKIISSAQASPIQAGKHNNYHITVVTDRAIIDAIEKAFSLKIGSDRQPLFGAPVLIIVSIKSNDEEIENMEYVTSGIIAHNMLLTAENLGLGTCYIRGVIRYILDNQVVMTKLNLPDGFKPVGGLVLGYTDENIEETIKHKNLIEVSYLKPKEAKTKDL